MPVDVALMIEGQQGLTWPRWQGIARVAEDAGFAGLYRSDHFVERDGPAEPALDTWASLAWLASHTGRIQFGPVVSPLSFRNPVTTAWTAAAIDDLSGGRLRLGLGAGWQEREHESFGFDLLDLDQRFTRFEEGLEVVTRLLRADGPVSFSGEFFTLKDAELLPRPARPGGPPIVIGGNGPRRTLPLAARFADEWNGVYLTADGFAERSAQLDDMLRAEGRQPGDVRRTLMTRVVFGRDRSEIDAKLGDADRAALEARGVLIGDGPAIRDGLAALAAAGVETVMLQWIDGMDDLAGIEALGQVVVE